MRLTRDLTTFRSPLTFARAPYPVLGGAAKRLSKKGLGVGNVISGAIICLGGLAASVARPWWEANFTTEFNPAVIVGIALVVAFFMRGLLDPR